MDWRLLVEEVDGSVDSGIFLASDERRRTGLAYSEEYIWSLYEVDITSPLTPGSSTIAALRRPTRSRRSATLTARLGREYGRRT